MLFVKRELGKKKKSQVLCWSLTVDGYHSKIKIKKWNGPPLSFSTTHPSPTLQSLHRLPVVLHFYGTPLFQVFNFVIFSLLHSHCQSLSLSLSPAFHPQEQKTLSLSLLRFILKNRKFDLFTAAKLLLTLTAKFHLFTIADIFVV